tara:strand:- start:3346 stop:3747 length:402 start_codon:yes stop_codon:yes gene_type:complete
MAKGKIKLIDNKDRKFGSSGQYLCLKVEADYSATAEEYLLLTEKEFEVAQSRGEDNPEDTEGLKLGVLSLRKNKDRRFGAALHYYAVKVHDLEGNTQSLLFTDAGLESARRRSESNEEDVEANKTGWLADLFD